MANSVINLDGLSAPMTKLVEVVAQGIGGIYAPIGIVRAAKAEAKATVIRTNAEIQALDLQERASQRLNFRESIRQENLESICAKAATEMPEEVSDAPVDRDWLFQYLDRAQDVNDDEMQNVWARILAGEVTTPGTYSKRTLQFLQTLDKSEATAFTSFCSFLVHTQDNASFIFDNPYVNKVLDDHLGSGFQYIDHFTAIGLLSPEPVVINASKMVGLKLRYFDTEIDVIGRSPLQNPPDHIPQLELPIACRLLTEVGRQLFKISGARAFPGFLTGLANQLDEQFKVKMICK